MPDPIDPDNDLVRLAKLVLAMREAQRKYFRGRKGGPNAALMTAAHLERSKELERKVDQAVAWVLKYHQPQENLFLDADGPQGPGAY